MQFDVKCKEIYVSTPAGSSGGYTRALDLPQPDPNGSTINPGSTWYFQAWFREPVGALCGTGLGTTNAISVTVLP